MLKLVTAILAIMCALGVISTANAAQFGRQLCDQADYTCLKVARGQTWRSLFPDDNDRMIVKKVNRMNTSLRAGMIIAVPKNLNNVNLLDLSPLPHQGTPSSVMVDLSDLAWGAYDSNGKLINWGPVSGGKNYCPDVGRGCKTLTGNYTFYRKQGAGCVSSKFPIPRGGAPMPYCMHFRGGYAMHASATVPGYNASHGCVRMFYEDAQWLNLNFVNVGRTQVRIIP
ncbi:MAG: L,D-transpeptidase [Candidatus Berkiella sp.]